MIEHTGQQVSNFSTGKLYSLDILNCYCLYDLCAIFSWYCLRADSQLLAKSHTQHGKTFFLKGPFLVLVTNYNCTNTLAPRLSPAAISDFHPRVLSTIAHPWVLPTFQPRILLKEWKENKSELWKVLKGPLTLASLAYRNFSFPGL